MTTGLAVEQLHILMQYTLCKAGQRPCPVSNMNMKEHTISKSTRGSDDEHIEKSVTAGLVRQ